MSHDGSAPAVIQVDETPDRQGWAVVTLTGPVAAPAVVRLLGETIIDLLVSGVDTITVDAASADRLCPAACRVLVDAARHARRAGGCLVASGLSPLERTVLRAYDVDRRLDLAR